MEASGTDGLSAHTKTETIYYCYDCQTVALEIRPCEKCQNAMVATGTFETFEPALGEKQ